MLYQCSDGTAIGQKIHELADNKRLKQVKKLAYWYSNNWWSTDNNELVKKLIQDRDFTIVTVSRGTRVTYLFEGKPEHNLAQIDAIPRRKKGKTPHKVLVKMLFTRLRGLQGRIELLKQVQSQSKPSTGSGWSPTQYKVPVLTRESLSDLVKVCKGSTPHIMEHAKGMMPVIEREDVTGKVLDDAWDLFSASLVMEA